MCLFWEFPGGAAVRTLVPLLLRAWVQSLVEELRSDRPSCIAQKERKEKKICKRDSRDSTIELKKRFLPYLKYINKYPTKIVVLSNILF